MSLLCKVLKKRKRNSWHFENKTTNKKKVAVMDYMIPSKIHSGFFWDPFIYFETNTQTIIWLFCLFVCCFFSNNQIDWLRFCVNRKKILVFWNSQIFDFIFILVCWIYGLFLFSLFLVPTKTTTTKKINPSLPSTN